MEIIQYLFKGTYDVALGCNYTKVVVCKSIVHYSNSAVIILSVIIVEFNLQLEQVK